MTVIAGEEFKITVPFTASPKPRPTWTINTIEVLTDERIKFDTKFDETIFINKSAKRSETGIYTIHLINSEGTDSASCRVLVVDRPSPPQGPLDVVDVTPETCTLAWRPSADDGGSPITNYVIEKIDQNGLWTKVSSFVRSCHYDVMGLEPQRKYFFRIRAENQYGLSEPLELDEPVIAKYSFTVPDPPSAPRITDWDSGNVTLTWDRPRHDGGSRIQGYKIEFRDIEDPAWRINDFMVRDNNYQVYNLESGHEYEFRIRAKNAAGLSKPSPPSKQFKLKGKFTVPSAPGTPTVQKVGKNYVDLKWEVPKSDGGSKITGYIIERRDMGGAIWVKTNDYNVNQTEFTVTNLIEMTDYEFRIFAVNAAGRSEPSSCTMPIKICEVLGGEKPEWVRFIQNQIVPQGRTALIECEAKGKPEPTSRWLKNGKEIKLGGRFKTASINCVFTLEISDVGAGDNGDYTCEAINSLGFVHTTGHIKTGQPPKIERLPNDLYLPELDNTKIKIYYSGDQTIAVKLTKDGLTINENEHIKYTTFDDYIIIFIKEITKDDAGSYTLSLTNDSGSVSGQFNIFVTGLPGPPTGPLDITDISKHNCTLQWKPPTYDGGSRVTHYVIERKDVTLTHWICINSSCKDTKFTIQGLTEGQEYLFRVMAVNENGHGPSLDGLNPIKAKLPFDPPSQPGIPKILEVGGDFAHLEWDRPEFDGGARIQGYWIDKREVGCVAWQRINVALCSTNQINASNLIEGRQYEFRVFAQNEAGLSKESSNSGSIKIIDPKAATPPEIIKPLKPANCIQNHNAKFKCEIIGEPKPVITWYKGAREITNGSRYNIYSENSTHYLTVNDVFGEDADEYVCRAVNKAGTKSTRAELLIMTAPKLNVPPRFRDTAFFDKGENVVIKVPFTGHPKPRITWIREGKNFNFRILLAIKIKKLETKKWIFKKKFQELSKIQNFSKIPFFFLFSE